MEENNKIKTGQITVFVDGNIKLAKKKSGLTWRSLIIRGLKSLSKGDDEETELREKVVKMAAKLQEQSIRIYKLENKDLEK